MHIWEDPEIYKIWIVNQANQNDWPKENWKKISHKSGENIGNPLQYSCLESPMDRGVWQSAVQGCQRVDATKRLTLHYYYYYVEKETATQSSILAWRTPWTEEPNGLQSTGSQRVGHN